MVLHLRNVISHARFVTVTSASTTHYYALHYYACVFVVIAAYVRMPLYEWREAYVHAHPSIFILLFSRLKLVTFLTEKEAQIELQASEITTSEERMRHLQTALQQTEVMIVDA